jgi:hypothetical protein
MRSLIGTSHQASPTTLAKDLLHYGDLGKGMDLPRLVRANLYTDATASAEFRVHNGHYRVMGYLLLGKEGEHFGRGGTSLGHRLRDILRGLTSSGQIDPCREALHRSQLRMRLAEEAMLIGGHPQLPG